MSSTLAEELILQAKSIGLEDCLHPPVNKEYDSADVVGTMTTLQIQLFTLWRRLSRIADVKEIDAEYTEISNRDPGELMREYEEAQYSADLCEHILESELRRSCGRWTKSVWVNSEGLIVLLDSVGDESERSSSRDND